MAKASRMVMRFSGLVESVEEGGGGSRDDDTDGGTGCCCRFG